MLSQITKQKAWRNMILVVIKDFNVTINCSLAKRQWYMSICHWSNILSIFIITKKGRQTGSKSKYSADMITLIIAHIIFEYDFFRVASYAYVMFYLPWWCESVQDASSLTKNVYTFMFLFSYVLLVRRFFIFKVRNIFALVYTLRVFFNDFFHLFNKEESVSRKDVIVMLFLIK